MCHWCLLHECVSTILPHLGEAFWHLSTGAPQEQGNLPIKTVTVTMKTTY
eukprot:jgi/Botrbrau1/5739/Bobra.0134s0013.1